MGVRILHVSQPTDGGTAVVVGHLVRASVAAGHHVTVACPEGALAAEVRRAGATWVAVPLRRTPVPADLIHLVTLRRLMRDHAVVHLHSSKAGAVGRLAAATLRHRSRPRSVFTPHGWSWYVGGRLSPVWKAWERVAVTRVDAVTATSRLEADDGRRVLGPEGDIRLVEIPNGVDGEVYTPEGDVAPRPPSGHLLVCVGRLSRQKGQDRLLHALALMPNRSVTLRLVGAGPDEGLLRSLATELGVAERVEMIGSEDPRPHYRSADLVVLPSRWEGHPLVLLEAMACGAAVTATAAALGDCSLPPVPLAPASPQGLAQVISDLLDDRDLRRKIGRAGRAHVLAHRSLGSAMARHLELLSDLARSDHRTPPSSPTRTDTQSRPRPTTPPSARNDTCRYELFRPVASPLPSTAETQR